MGHEEWGVTNRPMDSDSVGPKHEGSHVDPLGVLIIAGLHEGFTDVKVFLLDNTISLGIVRRNLDVMDAIFFGKITSHCHERRTIVGNNLSDSTPSTEDVFEYKIAESLLIFLLKGPPFRPRRHGTTSLDEIVKLVYSWHEHGVDVNLPKEGGNVGNSRGQMKMTGLTSLAQMTCGNEPLHIFLQHGPPESLSKIGECGKDSPVANCLMCPRDEGEALVYRNDDLVSALEIATHKHTIH